MKTDITRSTFDPRKHFAAVLLQQGRVPMDADANEQADITQHLREAGVADLVGPAGAPLHNDGFRLVATAAGLTPAEQARPGNAAPPPLPSLAGGWDFYITAGHFYVNGILAENDRIAPFSAQPDSPGAALPQVGNSPQEGTYLAYLDVWRRGITALEDPSIREVALGGPDTATRSKTIWQVRLFRLGPSSLTDAEANCLTQSAGWNTEIAPGTGRIAARAEPGAQSTSPCIVAPGAGYRRLENQLYRLEVHTGGTLGTATFKWSRENASVVAAWTGQQGASNEILLLATPPRDTHLGFASGQWIELTDDTRELRGESGTLVQIIKVEGTSITVDPATATDTLVRASFPANPKIRRWDHTALLQPADTVTFHDLEGGVQARFETGTYRRGDYWLIPARTAIGDIEWPRDAASQSLALPPHGVAHQFARLAVMRFNGAAWTAISDCRPLFPPATELVSLLHVGGDGQEAMPGNTLPQPLQVRVARGQWPVIGRRVRFTVTAGGGNLSGPQSIITTTTGPDGIAQCTWTLGSTVPSPQRVEAVLLDAAGNPVPGQVVAFNANQSIASQVAYDPGACTQLAGATNVQLALDRLARLVRLSLAGGDGQESIPGQPLPQPLRVTVANACGPVVGARVRFTASRAGSRVAANAAGLPGATNTLELDTVAGGLAECVWQLDSTTGAPESQTLTAELIATPGSPALPIAAPATVRFTANLDTPGTGEGCDATVGPGGQFATLADAFKALTDSKPHLCLCLLPGIHPAGDDLKAPDSASVKITGCGTTASRIQFERAVTWAVGELILRDLGVILLGEAATLRIEARRATVEDCAWIRSGLVPNPPPLVTVGPPTELLWTGNRMTAMRLLSSSTTNPFGVFADRVRDAGVRGNFLELSKLNPISQAEAFDRQLEASVNAILQLPPQARADLVTPRTGGSPRGRRLTRAARAALASGGRWDAVLAARDPSILLGNPHQIQPLTSRPSVTPGRPDPEDAFIAAAAAPRPAAAAVRETLAELSVSAIAIDLADALALADSRVGGVIAGNVIMGHLLLNSASPRDLEGTAWISAANDPAIAGGSDLALRDNQLGRIRTRLPAVGAALPAHNAFQIAGNLFAVEEGTVIGSSVVLNGNQFRGVASGRVALRPRADNITVVGNDAGDMKVILGTARTGNHAEAANIADVRL